MKSQGHLVKVSHTISTEWVKFFTWSMLLAVTLTEWFLVPLANAWTQRVRDSAMYPFFLFRFFIDECDDTSDAEK